VLAAGWLDVASAAEDGAADVVDGAKDGTDCVAEAAVAADIFRLSSMEVALPCCSGASLGANVGSA